MYIYIYVDIYIYACMYIYMYIYILCIILNISYCILWTSHGMLPPTSPELHSIGRRRAEDLPPQGEEDQHTEHQKFKHPATENLGRHHRFV